MHAVRSEVVHTVPLYAWSMAWRRGSTSDVISALLDAATDVGGTKTGSGQLPEATPDTWLPAPEASRLAAGDLRLLSTGSGSVNPTRRATRTR